MTTTPDSTIAGDTYEELVRPHLAALNRALLDIDEPLLRLAVTAIVEDAEPKVLAALKTFAVREANEAGESFVTIGAALGVSHQRAHQLAHLPITEETITP